VRGATSRDDDLVRDLHQQIVVRQWTISCAPPHGARCASKRVILAGSCRRQHPVGAAKPGDRHPQPLRSVGGEPPGAGGSRYCRNEATRDCEIHSSASRRCEHPSALSVLRDARELVATPRRVCQSVSASAPADFTRLRR
jgi:hypothetical protein